MTRVLVAYGSKRGGTAEIAAWIGDELTARGWEAEVRPAAEVDDVDPYDVVVVGGSLYAGRWHKQARRFVRRHAEELRRRPVWVFSSGPLDHSADEGGLEQAPGVAKAVRRIGARGETTFGGVLRRDAKGWLAGALAEKTGGDFRRPERVRAWADEIAADVAVDRGPEAVDARRRST